MSARFNHPVQSGQVVAMLNGMLCRAKYDRAGVGFECFQPEPLDLVDLLGI